MFPMTWLRGTCGGSFTSIAGPGSPPPGTNWSATWPTALRPASSRVLEGKTRSAGVSPDFEPTAALLADAAVASNDPARLKAWWVFRMLFGPDPLGERLTLVWHDHFATSNVKVKNLAAMRRQNDLFRRHGRGPFGMLLDAVVRDPALLIWLDASSNREGHLNENLARELMELFTLGIGPYSESDVKESARALSGWTVEDDLFREIAHRHDDGTKTIMGHTGKLTARRPLADLDGTPGSLETAGPTALRVADGREGGLGDGHRRARGWAARPRSRHRLGGRHGAQVAGILGSCQLAFACAGPG